MENISKEKILAIKKSFEEKIKNAKDEIFLSDLRVEFLGRKSELVGILKNLKTLSIKERKEIGTLANQTRQEINDVLKEVIKKTKQQTDLEKDWIDVTAPGDEDYIGRMNILSQTQKEIENVFASMGFEIADGPEIETEYYNFDALNIPKNHPASDAWDTFWLKDKSPKGDRLALRPHTSPMQIRFMEKHTPPFRIIAPGRCFRNEATDATHEHTFSQFEALVVGEKINTANFKDVAEKFFSAFFKEKVEIRLRPSYFPFTEPSFEFDISCTVCKGKKCPSCKHTGWLEIGGCGMVNQRVFEAVGYKRNQWQGFAWGFGIERLAMMKHKINDIRLFMSGDLRFIKQF